MYEKKKSSVTVLPLKRVMLVRNSFLCKKKMTRPLCSSENIRGPLARRDRIVVSTLRCGRSNPGSNPGHGK